MSSGSISSSRRVRGSRFALALIGALALAGALVFPADAKKPPHPHPTPSPTPSPTASPTPSPTGIPSAFVTACGQALCLSGQPYVFTGLNVYNANSRWTCWYPFGSQLDESLSVVHGDEAIRAWFFDPLAMTNGQRDWSKFDETFASLRAAGLRAVVTLADQGGTCDGGVYRDANWYASGYKGAYRSYVSQIVTRYRTEPAILMWQLVNEAEVKTSESGSCAPNAAALLQSFAADMAGLVKSIDQNHLLSMGTIGSGQCGASGSTDYRALHAIPGIDLCEYHDYNPEPMPGDQWNGLQTRINDCAAVGKPMFAGEMGALGSIGLQARADQFAAKFSAQLGAGIDGILLWAWCDPAMGPQPACNSSNYDITPGDPALAVINQ